MAHDTESYPLRIEKALLKRAEKLAQLEQRTVASLIRFALCKYIDEREEFSKFQK